MSRPLLKPGTVLVITGKQLDSSPTPVDGHASSDTADDAAGAAGSVPTERVYWPEKQRRLCVKVAAFADVPVDGDGSTCADGVVPVRSAHLLANGEYEMTVVAVLPPHWRA